MKKEITLVVMAAGMGSRFGGLKQIEPVGRNGEAILDFSVYDAIKAGFTKVVFVIKHAIEKDFKEIVGKRIEKKIKVEYVFQETDILPQGYTCPADREKPWGTAHAILCCKDVVKEPFAVVNADDFYGRSAFEQIAEYLQNEEKNYCMVGFRLVNTLTENGHVSRGVCEIDNHSCLTKVTERTKIINCKYTEDDGKTWEPLSPDTVVSMNLWGFMPDIFNHIEKGFKEFLNEKINVPKSEYYLPSVVSTLIENGQKSVDVLVAEDKWYGVTYKEDKQNVVNAIGAMIDAGLYDNI
ncbi:MAG: NTP transferase domain-containing protein [Clostridia bacterium]|nr:NTP transferase domain-containing protein [Clostridia bacterium]